MIGGGPVGLAYAIWLKRERPELTVLVVERRGTPGWKIGESLLGVTVTMLRSLGFTFPQLRRLFANKVSFSLWWAGPETNRPRTHVDVLDIEETFNVERRVLDTAMQRLALRAGVELLTGFSVRIDDSTLSAAGSTLACERDDGGVVTVRARLVCDASGPASVIPRHLGLYRDRYDGVNANAYFAYFRRKEEPDLEYWRTAATRHLVYPEGWMWFITLCYWEQATDEALVGLVDDILDRDGPEEALPTRADLAAAHGCPYEEVVSIGVVPREDLDASKHLPPTERFQFYRDRYPAIDWMMSHFELVERPYPELPTMFSIETFVHDCERYCGDGWIAIGDAAMFINPFFSPGLAFGTATAFMAVRDTVWALDHNDVSRVRFSMFNDYATRLFEGLGRENNMLYRGFRHEDSYERTLMLKFFGGVTDVIGRDSYDEADPFAYQLFEPRFARAEQRVVDVQEQCERDEVAPEEMAARVRQAIEPYIEYLRHDPVVVATRVGNYFTHYTDDLTRVEQRERQQGDFLSIRCENCRTFVDRTLGRCFVCGDPIPAVDDRPA